MKMSSFKTITLSLIAALAFTACGGGGGGGSENNPGTPSPTPTPQQPTPEPTISTQVSGVVAKGIVSNGIVRIYPLNGGSVDFNTVLATASTDANGHYTAALTDYDGGPLYIQITAREDGSTGMRCDLSEGCDGTPFGSEFSITDIDFALDAVVPGFTGNSLSSNVSTLSSTAAKLALNQLASTTDTSARAVNQLIADANSSVVNRFGMVGNLLEMPIVDLTNPSAVQSADRDALEFNFLNAAIVAATQSGSSSLSFVDALSVFANQYAANTGLADTETGATERVTLEEILNNATALIQTVEAADSNHNLDLAALETQLHAQANQAGNGSSSPVNGTPISQSPTELIAVKSMVTDIRNLKTGADLSDPEAFTDKVELATRTFDDHAGDVMEAVTRTVEAILQAVTEWQDDKSLTQYEYNNLNVTITDDANGTTFSSGSEPSAPIMVTNASGGQTAVEVMMVAELADFEISESATERSVDVELSVSCAASSTWVRFDISQGQIIAHLQSSSEDSLTSNTDNENISYEDTAASSSTLESIVMNLSISLAQVTGSVDDPITFSGNYQIDASGFANSREETDTWITDADAGLISWLDIWSDSTTVGNMSASVSGGISSASGESLTASIAFGLRGDGATFNCNGIDEGDLISQEYTSQETCDEETSDEWVGLNFAISFAQDLSGVADDASLLFSGERTGLDDAILGLEISYGETMLEIEYDSLADQDNIEQITIRNQDGIVVTLVEEINDGEKTQSGSIVFNDTEFATISNDLGFIAISYNDGTNESL